MERNQKNHDAQDVHKMMLKIKNKGWPQYQGVQAYFDNPTLPCMEV